MAEYTSRSFDLLTLGQLLLRLSPPDNDRLSRGDTFVKQVGGAELNVAVGASLLGLRTGVISKLPSHDIGSFMKAKVIYDRMNSSFFSLNIDEIPKEVYTASKCFHTTGITLALSPQIRETTIEMIKRFKEAGTLVSFDVNFRGNLWSGDEARECILKILPYVDIFFCSEDTARLTFLKTGTAKEMMKSFTEEYPISIVASTQRIVHSPKRHTFGSVIYDAARDTYYEEEPYRDIEVVDRIGSGDAYISGALYGLLSSGGDCSKAIAFGNATAAVKNTIPGDLPSSNLEEIQTIIKAHNQSGPQSEMGR